MNSPVPSEEKVESFTLKVGGKPFRCQCGANVFHKPWPDDVNFYKCNGCGEQYQGAA